MSYEELMENEEIENLVASTFESISMTDMAVFWLDFLQMCDALFLSTHANHAAKNLQDMVDSQRAMLPWLGAYDNNNYFRWLPHFWSMLSSLPPDRRNYLEQNFAHSITGNPYSGQPLDMIIEITMNKGSKLKSGWLSMLKNEKQLLVHSRNVNNVNRIRRAVHEFIDKKKIGRKHTDASPYRMRVDEQLIQDLLTCVEEFECNPFDPLLPTLRTLQSAIPASDKLVEDFRTAFEFGEAKVEKFLEDRIFSKVKSIYDKESQSKRMSFAKDEIISINQEKSAAASAMEHHGLSTIVELIGEKEYMLFTSTHHTSDLGR
jgi:hypothetical protein